MAKILIIDDDNSILSLMTKSCRQQGHEVVPVQSGKEGLTALDAERPDLMIVDLLIGDMNGLDIIRHGRSRHPGTEVIMVTANGSVETAVEAMRLGAFDYLTKPFEISDLRKTVDLALAHRDSPSGSEDPSSIADDPASGAPPRDEVSLIGESPRTREILEVIGKIADNDSPVLLEGEFGAGKQMVARSIHNASARSEAPFKVLQCSALSEELLEAELFGHPGEPGGQTIFHRAHGGTVLLEEIHLLPRRLQSKLDAYLEEVAARRFSGSLPASMNARFIASAAKSLEACVEERTFREDLFYRISVIPISVPPLRKRKEDILPLAVHFLDRHAEGSGKKVPEIDAYARKLLDEYPWPGNVGELENAMERACAFSDGRRIRPVDLPPKVSQKVAITDEEEKTIHHLPVGNTLSSYIRKQERLFIRETLKFNEGSREKSASMLGVSIATLYRKMGIKSEKRQKTTA